MEKILNIDTREILLKFNEGANCWQTKTIIDGIEIDIEIDLNYHHKEKEVNWNHFLDFSTFLNQGNRLRSLIRDSNDLAFEVGKAFYRERYENVVDYKMEFSNSLYYNGKTDGSFVQNGSSYSLIFNFCTKRENGIHGDDYGLYLVDIENLFIVGARRIQV
jgi:hypothetical protein